MVCWLSAGLAPKRLLVADEPGVDCGLSPGFAPNSVLVLDGAVDEPAPNIPEELGCVVSDCGLPWPKRVLVLCCCLPKPANTEEPPTELVGGGPAGVVEGLGEKREVGFEVAGVPKPEKGVAPLVPAVVDA